MNSEPKTYAWYPDPEGGPGKTQQELEEQAALAWEQANLTLDAQLAFPLRPSWRQPCWRPDQMLIHICSHDAAELVELLYPRCPELFDAARNISLSTALFSNIWGTPPYSTDVLMQCCSAQRGHLNAACLCALTGAVGALEELLELGADPNGLETTDSFSYICLADSLILPVTPMDCALLTDHEDCQLVLENYGGQSLHQHIARL